MKTALENLIVVLKDENTISPYEMCSSGLVQALFTVLNNVGNPLDPSHCAIVFNLGGLRLCVLTVCVSLCCRVLMAMLSRTASL